MITIAARTCPECSDKFVPKSVKHKYCSKECRERSKPTPEAPKYTVTDPSNHLLSLGTPSAMSCGVMETEDGPYLIVTVRTTSATVTVSLSEKEALGWLIEIGKKISAMQKSNPES
jgi:hypothetical protein